MSVEYSFLLARLGLISFSLRLSGSEDFGELFGELIVAICFFARRILSHKSVSYWFSEPQKGNEYKKK